LCVLAHIEDKFPTFVSSKAQEGIALAYASRVHLGWSAKSLPAAAIARLYAMLRSKQARISFVRSLLKPFAFLDNSESENVQLLRQQQLGVDIGFLGFTAEVIAACQLSAPQEDEPRHQLVVAIDRLTLLRGGDVAASLKKEPWSAYHRIATAAIVLLLLAKRAAISAGNAATQNIGAKVSETEAAVAASENSTTLHKLLKTLLREDNADADAAVLSLVVGGSVCSTSALIKHHRTRTPKPGANAATTAAAERGSKKRRRTPITAATKTEMDDSDPDYSE